MIRVQIPIRPATDPTNLAGLVTPSAYPWESTGSHVAPVQSFDAERMEHLTDRDGLVRDTLGRHVGEMGGAS